MVGSHWDAIAIGDIWKYRLAMRERKLNTRRVGILSPQKALYIYIYI